MFGETLAIGRDAALILLAVEALVFGAVFLVLIFYTTRGLKALVQRARSALAEARRRVLETLTAVDGVLLRIALRCAHWRARMTYAGAIWRALWRAIIPGR